jgi:hypothetical protein
MRCQRILTVCWLEGWVSFAVWENSGKGFEFAQFNEMPAGECTADTFVDAVDELRYVSGGIFSTVRWIIVEESFPGDLSVDASSKIGQSNHHLPFWMRQCWEELPTSYLPGRVTSGSRCLLFLLNGWEEFHQPGAGFHFTLLGRGYFFGFGDRDCLLRVSRKAGQTCGDFSEEWMRQTSMLYRNRTGTELTQIFVMGDQSGLEVDDWNTNVSVRTALNPPKWMRRGQDDGSNELSFFHAAGLLAADQGNLDIDLIEQARHGRRMDTALRWCSFLLMGTWMLLWVGACRSTEVQAGNAESERRLWENEQMRWVQSHRKWMSTHEARAREAAPLRVAGVLARSLPDTAEIDRIHLEGGGDTVPFEVEGSYQGENASDEFKEWFVRLGNESSPINIRNLEFEPVKKGLLFRITGDASLGRKMK